jgi:hypothetical protein
MRQHSRRVQVALEKEAALRLARFERLESWEGLVAGDPVKIVGRRGGSWHFRAFVTNSSNGASWVEVSETLATGGRRKPSAGGDEEGGGLVDGPAHSMTRVRSFRPELVVPLRRTRRRPGPKVGAARKVERSGSEAGAAGSAERPGLLLPLGSASSASQGALFDTTRLDADQP